MSGDLRKSREDHKLELREQGSAVKEIKSDKTGDKVMKGFIGHFKIMGSTLSDTEKQ